MSLLFPNIEIRCILWIHPLPLIILAPLIPQFIIPARKAANLPGKVIYFCRELDKIKVTWKNIFHRLLGLLSACAVKKLTSSTFSSLTFIQNSPRKETRNPLKLLPPNLELIFPTLPHPILMYNRSEMFLQKHKNLSEPSTPRPHRDAQRITCHNHMTFTRVPSADLIWQWFP